jgi:hypothetical protein
MFDCKCTGLIDWSNSHTNVKPVQASLDRSTTLVIPMIHIPPPLPLCHRAILARHDTHAFPPQLKSRARKRKHVAHLAGSRAGDVGALAALDTTGDGDTRPLPVGAGTLGAEDVDLLGLGTDGTLDVLDGKTGDRDAGCGLASGRTVLVVLLDQNTGLGDVLEGDALVDDVLDILLATRTGFSWMGFLRLP